MSVPHVILDNLPSMCQKLSDLVEVLRSYNKNNFACFWDTVCNNVNCQTGLSRVTCTRQRCHKSRQKNRDVSPWPWPWTSGPC